MTLNVSQNPFIEYCTSGGPQTREKADLAAEGRVLEMLKPLFNGGWQLDGTFKSAVSLGWGNARGFFMDTYRLKEATAQLIRYD